MDLSDDEQPDIVISAEAVEGSDDEVEFVQTVLVPDDSGVITQVISGPIKQPTRERRQVVAEQVFDYLTGSQFGISQVLNPSQVPSEILIRVKYIYNFLLFHATYMSLLNVFIT